MARTPLTRKILTHKAQLLIGRLVNSDIGGRVVNLPPVAWILRYGSRRVFEGHLRKNNTQPGQVTQTAPAYLASTLDTIARDVVEVLGYAAAMVATFEQGDVLSIRAYYVDPAMATGEQIRGWEADLTVFSPDRPLSLSDPEVARVYVRQSKYKDNLSVRAALSGQPMRSGELYDLFTPIVPLAAKPSIQGVQQALGIQGVIAVPFFVQAAAEGPGARELVGNLFALNRELITDRDERELAAFAHQAAAVILSERLRMRIQEVQRLTYDIQANLRSEEKILRRIVEGVVHDLGYVGAMVATREGDALPVRAYYADPSVATDAQIRAWETQLAELNPGSPISISDPNIARVYLRNAKDANNLSVQAADSGRPKSSAELYDLFTPIVPPVSRPIVQGIQDALGVGSVIAVPFFLPASHDGQLDRDLVGNLFALSRSYEFSGGEVELLEAFGQQAAIGLKNAQLYHQVENQRTAAQIFGKMAFSAAAAVHDLRAQLGLVGMTVKQLKLDPIANNAELQQQINEYLGQMSKHLETLHEPFREVPDKPTDINDCLYRALRKLGLDDTDWVTIDLEEDLPSIFTSPAMLSEAFRVLIKNATEAIAEKRSGRDLRITSRRDGGTIEVTIRDNGTGIKPENQGKIFDMRWTTKKTGLGFGLYWTKDYIEGLGGTLSVESEWQQGTTFRVCIPAQIESVTASTQLDTTSDR